MHLEKKRPRRENILFKKWKIRGWRAFGRLRKVELGEEVHLGGNCKCRRRAKFYSNMFIEDDKDNDEDGDDEVDDDYEVDEEGCKCLACFSSSVAIALKYTFENFMTQLSLLLKLKSYLEKMIKVGI